MVPVLALLADLREGKERDGLGDLLEVTLPTKLKVKERRKILYENLTRFGRLRKKRERRKKFLVRI